jgi:hypothetical protein
MWNYSMELGGRGKGKQNDSESIISKYIISMQEEDITICTENCCGREGLRQSDRKN